MAKVLLVDDDVDVQEANRTVLESAGYEVALAFTAAEAREALEKEVPDIVVLDVMMEKIDAGFDASRDIRKKYPNLPILMLTSIHDNVDKALRFAPDDTWLPVAKFVEKPLAPQELLAEVKALLQANK
jgi:DNA-binding response OmpR family regulator